MQLEAHNYRDDPRWRALQEVIRHEPAILREGLDITVRTLAVVALEVIESQYATWAANGGAHDPGEEVARGAYLAIAAELLEAK